MFKLIKKILPYLFLIIVTVLTFFYVYRSWAFNLNIPYFYRGDAQWNIASIKGYIESGKFIKSDNIGAPFGTNYYDYPNSDGLYKATVIVLAFFTKDAVAVLNLYYFLTFILTSITAFFALKYFKISSNLALLSSFIISFLSYHVGKGTSHIGLGTYYIIPLFVIVLHWIFTDQLKIRNNFKDFIRSKLFYSILILFLLANSGIYYSLFTISFLAVAGIISSFERKNIKNLLIAFLLSLVIVLAISINVLPNLIHQFKYGKNPNIGLRSFNEAEYYGLKIIELFTPVTSFNNNYVRKFKERYYNLTFTKSEGYSYLGVFGSIGFILLVLNLFSKRSFDKRIDYLSYLNLWALSLSVTTGLGTIIGYLISSQIRVYARISIFIAIFSVFGLTFVLDKYIRKLPKYKWLINIVFIFIFIFVILDQPKPITVDAIGTAKLYLSDKKFIEKIEMDGSRSMIFQLPYKSFPESAPVNSLTDYDLFRPYIHSKKLKWSYGIIKETPQDKWIKTISNLPTKEMLEKVTLAGYDGIYIDTVGYIDKAMSLENELSILLNEKPIKSGQSDLMFFNLNNYKKGLIDLFGKDKFTDMKKQTLTLPIIIGWGKGFYQEETDSVNTWHWSKNQSSLTIINDNIENKNITLKFDVVSNYPEYSNLVISSKLFTQNLRINETATSFEKQIILPQGKLEIQFNTDAKKVILPNNERDLYFRIFNLKTE